MKPAKLLASSSLAAFILFASVSAHADVSRNTQNFIQNAAMSNMLEIQTSQRALQVSQNAEIRDFAQQMIDDHKSAEQKLETALKDEGNGLDKLIPASLDSKHQKIADRLDKERNKDFEKDYVGVQRDGHNDAVSLFTKYSKNGDDGALKTLAGQLLPTLQHHQSMADDLYKKYRNEKTANTASALEPAAGSTTAEPAAAGDPTENDTKGNPNTDRPATNADINTDAPTTVNPTEGRSSPSGGPTY